MSNYAFALTEKELNNMPKEKVKVLPAIDVMKSEGASENFYYFMLEMLLLDLRYYYEEPKGYLSDNLKEAIKLFQSDIDHEPNGILTAEQFEILKNRHDMVSGIEVYPSPVSVYISKVGNYLSAEGTWVFENDVQADPLQTSKIKCSLYYQRCYMATARITSGFQQTYDDNCSLKVDIEEFNITKWSEYEILAENDNAACVTYTLSINPNKNEAFMFRRRKGVSNCNGITEKPQILKLVGGFEIGREFWQKQHSEANKIRSSKYRELLKNFEE